MSSPLNSTQQRRSWTIRLTIAALLLSLCTPIIWVLVQNHLRTRAIAKVSELRGYYQEGSPTYPQWTDKVRPVTGDQLLQPFKTPSDYQRVDLFFKPVTDADLEKIVSINKITQLDLMGTKITDAGIRSLRHQTSLESLELAHTKITDACLVHLKDMTHLRRLRLEYCNITDAAIPHLQAIRSPDIFIRLEGTRVTSIKAGELKIITTDGKPGPFHQGEKLIMTGSYTVADPNYTLDELDVEILGTEEGSNEASLFGDLRCIPVRSMTQPGRFDFEAKLPAPLRAGTFTVRATAYASLHGFRGAYTAGRSILQVAP